MARIIAVCSSESKGTPKDNINTGVIKEDLGLVGDDVRIKEDGE